MNTLADAGILAGCCAAVWLLVAPLARRRGWFGRVALYAVGAALTTAAALAIGRWREHVRLTPAAAGVVGGGMCAFWILVALQRTRPADPGAAATSSSTERGVQPATTAAEADGARGGAGLTRRERRLANRRRFPGPHRRHQRVGV